MKTTIAQRKAANGWKARNPEKSKYVSYRSKMNKFLNEMATIDDFDKIMTCVENYRKRVGR